MRLACARHLRDLETGPTRGLAWSHAHAGHALDFFPKFLQLRQAHSGQPFTLQPWQQFIVGSLFGWLGADGYRRFTTAYIETGKESGKSPLLAGIGLYGLIFDGAEEAEVYAAAATREQASIMFRDAKAMVEDSPELSGIVTVNACNLLVASTRSYFRPISSEGKGLDGKRVRVALIDELHKHPTDEVVDQMRRGMKNPNDSLLAMITNSGFDRESICWQEREYSARVLEGVVDNDSRFAYICQLDACEACRAGRKDQPQAGCARCDDWRDERVWVKANPNLDVSLPRKYLRRLVDEAEGMPAKVNDLLRFNFCVWTQSYSRWIDVERWLACSTEIPDDELTGLPCYGGLDLGQKDDFSAWVRIWLLPDSRIAVRARFWIPEATVRRHPNRPYQQWRDAGLVEETEGDTADEAVIEEAIFQDAEHAGIREIAYDPAFATRLAQNLQGRGLLMIPTLQGFNLNEALLALAALVKDGQLCHGGNAVLSWMAANAIVRHGTKGEIRLDKQHAADKIDGISALAVALDRGVVRRTEDEQPMITVL